MKINGEQLCWVLNDLDGKTDVLIKVNGITKSLSDINAIYQEGMVILSDESTSTWLEKELPNI